jgi:hypothetical protein
MPPRQIMLSRLVGRYGDIDDIARLLAEMPALMDCTRQHDVRAARDSVTDLIVSRSTTLHGIR